MGGWQGAWRGGGSSHRAGGWRRAGVAAAAASGRGKLLPAGRSHLQLSSSPTSSSAGHSRSLSSRGSALRWRLLACSRFMRSRLRGPGGGAAGRRRQAAAGLCPASSSSSSPAARRPCPQHSRRAAAPHAAATAALPAALPAPLPASPAASASAAPCRAQVGHEHALVALDRLVVDDERHGLRGVLVPRRLHVRHLHALPPRLLLLDLAARGEGGSEGMGWCAARGAWQARGGGGARAWGVLTA